MSLTRDDLAAMDAADPLAHFRDRFDLPQGVVYLDGNSLGAAPKATAPRIEKMIRGEWAKDLIKSWNVHDWYPAPLRVGAKIARLIGAAPDEVTVADSTSVNLFKLLAGALKLRPGRKVILSEPGNFPTDLYVMQGLARLLGDVELRTVARDQLIDAIDEDVAVVSLTHVHYKSGLRHDMAGLTARAHEKGALMLWDLCHTAGAIQCDLNGVGADLAVGCGYKYLNGGPGAPSFVFVAKRHQDEIFNPLTGWLGHAQPFAFTDDFAPAPGIRRQIAGTPSMLGLTALECGVDIFMDADMAALEAKSARLCDLFVELVEERCAGHGLELASPREAKVRGSQISFSHSEAYAIVQALIARGVIGDFRAPDIARFGWTPLYARFVDVWDAAETLREVMAARAWDVPEFKARAAVT